jgi:catechol 2,3-dioxygenase-like lactoylglutathione lyase family enzyme
MEETMAAIRYLVSDVERAVGFYTKNLGFSLKQQAGPAIAQVTRDDLSLWLSGPASSAARPMPNGDVPEPGGWNRILIEVDDLPSRVADLKRAGVGFRGEIVGGPGGKKILVQDPDGNVVELFEPATSQ